MIEFILKLQVFLIFSIVPYGTLLLIIFFILNLLNKNCSTFGLKYVKRVIAVPGDTLELKGKEFFINGKKIKKKLIESNLIQSIYKETQYLKEYFVGNSNLSELKF